MNVCRLQGAKQGKCNEEVSGSIGGGFYGQVEYIMLGQKKGS